MVGTRVVIVSLLFLTGCIDYKRNEEAWRKIEETKKEMRCTSIVDRHVANLWALMIQGLRHTEIDLPEENQREILETLLDAFVALCIKESWDDLESTTTLK